MNALPPQALPVAGDAAGPDRYEPVFARSAEGFPVAKVGDDGYAMVPLAATGGQYLAQGWGLTRAPETWTKNDFFGHGVRLADEDEFRSKVFEAAQHRRERERLGRRETVGHAHTPWGRADSAAIYAKGVIFHATPSHGGFKLSRERNRAVHPMLRKESGWYEEDCEAAIVAVTFPDLFTTLERKSADKTVRDWYPDAWERMFERTLEPGESYVKDQRAFDAEHADDWIVISAVTSRDDPTVVETVATRGGRRSSDPKERRFLVPSSEYRPGRFGFVIDEARHPECGARGVTNAGGVD